MGIFRPEILCDLLVYGLIGAAVDIGVFAVIVYGFGKTVCPSCVACYESKLMHDSVASGNGDLGTNSNNSIDNDPGSRLVFRARSATFATMIFCLLWLAFEVMDLRRSFFHMGRPGTEKRWVP